MSKKTNLQDSKKSLRAGAEKILQNKEAQLYNKTMEDIKHIVEELEIHKIELEMQNEELQAAHVELENSKQKYFDLYNLAPVGYVTMNHEGIIIEANLTISTMLGLVRSSLIHKKLSGFMAKEEQDTCYLYRKKILDSGKTQSCDMRMLKNDGTSFWAHIVGTLSENHNRDSSINIIISDISELKKAQEELLLKDEVMIAQSRQAAMGEMISMIAHQWRQPLAVVAMAVNNIRASMELDGEISDEEFTACTDTVSQKVQQLSETITNFTSFFKPANQIEQTTVEDILNTILSIIGKSLQSSNISLNIKNTTVTSLLLNKSSLVQVLLNILANAKEALLTNEPKEAQINISANETKEAIIISVCDNAGGIQKSIINKLGQPYFTTREELNGRGLGLYISKTIVEKHLLGTLTWHNGNQGACFVITLKRN